MSQLLPLQHKLLKRNLIQVCIKLKLIEIWKKKEILRYWDNGKKKKIMQLEA
jgi:hypothetical protein